MSTELLSSDAVAETLIVPQRMAVAALHAIDYDRGVAAIALGNEVEYGTATIGNRAPGVEQATFDLQPDAAVVPYMGKLGCHLDEIGLHYFPEIYATAAEAKAAVERHQEAGDKVIVMLPNDEEVVAALDPNADIDGLTDAGRLAGNFPATSLSVLDLADLALPHGLAGVAPGRITFLGQGRLVNQGAIQRLRDKYHIEPGRIITKDNSDAELPRLHETSDLIISAVGRAGLLRAEHLIRRPDDIQTPLLVVDAGVSRFRPDEEPAEDDPDITAVLGDVHPALYFRTGEPGEPLLRVSPAPVSFGRERVFFGSGVGRLTVGWLANNAIAAMERDARLQPIPVSTRWRRQAAAERMAA